MNTATSVLVSVFICLFSLIAGLVPENYDYDCGVGYCDVAQYQQCQMQNPFMRWGRQKARLTNYGNAMAIGIYPGFDACPKIPVFVAWNFTETDDWVINGCKRTELMARNEGVWSISVKLQLVSRPASGLAIIDTFFTVNGLPVLGSDATGSVLGVLLPKQVLSFTFIRRFNKGDRLQLGIASSNPNFGFVASYCNTGNNDDFCIPTNDTGVKSPAVLVAMAKIPEPDSKKCKDQQQQPQQSDRESVRG